MSSSSPFPSPYFSPSSRCSNRSPSQPPASSAPFMDRGYVTDNNATGLNKNYGYVPYGSSAYASSLNSLNANRQVTENNNLNYGPRNTSSFPSTPLLTFPTPPPATFVPMDFVPSAFCGASRSSLTAQNGQQNFVHPSMFQQFNQHHSESFLLAGRTDLTNNFARNADCNATVNSCDTSSAAGIESTLFDGKIRSELDNVFIDSMTNNSRSREKWKNEIAVVSACSVSSQIGINGTVGESCTRITSVDSGSRDCDGNNASNGKKTKKLLTSSSVSHDHRSIAVGTQREFSLFSAASLAAFSAPCVSSFFLPPSPASESLKKAPRAAVVHDYNCPAFSPSSLPSFALSSYLSCSSSFCLPSAAASCSVLPAAEHSLMPPSSGLQDNGNTATRLSHNTYNAISSLSASVPFSSFAVSLCPVSPPISYLFSSSPYSSLLRASSFSSACSSVSSACSSVSSASSSVSSACSSVSSACSSVSSACSFVPSACSSVPSACSSVPSACSSVSSACSSVLSACSSIPSACSSISSACSSISSACSSISSACSSISSACSSISSACSSISSAFSSSPTVFLSFLSSSTCSSSYTLSLPSVSPCSISSDAVAFSATSRCSATVALSVASSSVSSVSRSLPSRRTSANHFSTKYFASASVAAKSKFFGTASSSPAAALVLDRKDPVGARNFRICFNRKNGISSKSNNLCVLSSKKENNKSITPVSSVTTCVTSGSSVTSASCISADLSYPQMPSPKLRFEVLRTTSPPKASPACSIGNTNTRLLDANDSKAAVRGASMSHSLIRQKKKKSARQIFLLNESENPRVLRKQKSVANGPNVSDNALHTTSKLCDRIAMITSCDMFLKKKEKGNSNGNGSAAESTDNQSNDHRRYSNADAGGSYVSNSQTSGGEHEKKDDPGRAEYKINEVNSNVPCTMSSCHTEKLHAKAGEIKEEQKRRCNIKYGENVEEQKEEKRESGRGRSQKRQEDKDEEEGSNTSQSAQTKKEKKGKLTRNRRGESNICSKDATVSDSDAAPNVGNDAETRKDIVPLSSRKRKEGLKMRQYKRKAPKAYKLRSNKNEPKRLSNWHRMKLRHRKALNLNEDDLAKFNSGDDSDAYDGESAEKEDGEKKEKDSRYNHVDKGELGWIINRGEERQMENNKNGKEVKRKAKTIKQHSSDERSQGKGDGDVKREDASRNSCKQRNNRSKKHKCSSVKQRIEECTESEENNNEVTLCEHEEVTNIRDERKKQDDKEKGGESEKNKENCTDIFTTKRPGNSKCYGSAALTTLSSNKTKKTRKQKSICSGSSDCQSKKGVKEKGNEEKKISNTEFFGSSNAFVFDQSPSPTSCSYTLLWGATLERNSCVPVDESCSFDEEVEERIGTDMKRRENRNRTKEPLKEAKCKMLFTDAAKQKTSKKEIKKRTKNKGAKWQIEGELEQEGKLEEQIINVEEARVVLVGGSGNEAKLDDETGKSEVSGSNNDDKTVEVNKERHSIEETDDTNSAKKLANDEVCVHVESLKVEDRKAVAGVGERHCRTDRSEARQVIEKSKTERKTEVLEADVEMEDSDGESVVELSVMEDEKEKLQGDNKMEEQLPEKEAKQSEAEVEMEESEIEAKEEEPIVKVKAKESKAINKIVPSLPSMAEDEAAVVEDKVGWSVMGDKVEVTEEEDKIEVQEREDKTQVADGEDTTQVANGEGTTQVAHGEGTTQVAHGENKTQLADGEHEAQVADREDKTQVADRQGKTQVADGEDKKQVTEGKGKMQILEATDRMGLSKTVGKLLLLEAENKAVWQVMEDEENGLPDKAKSTCDDETKEKEKLKRSKIAQPKRLPREGEMKVENAGGSLEEERFSKWRKVKTQCTWSSPCDPCRRNNNLCVYDRACDKHHIHSNHTHKDSDICSNYSKDNIIGSAVLNNSIGPKRQEAHKDLINLEKEEPEKNTNQQLTAGSVDTKGKSTRTEERSTNELKHYLNRSRENSASCPCVDAADSDTKNSGLGNVFDERIKNKNAEISARYCGTCDCGNNRNNSNETDNYENNNEREISKVVKCETATGMISCPFFITELCKGGLEEETLFKKERPSCGVASKTNGKSTMPGYDYSEEIFCNKRTENNDTRKNSGKKYDSVSRRSMNRNIISRSGGKTIGVANVLPRCGMDENEENKPYFGKKGEIQGKKEKRVACTENENTLRIPKIETQEGNGFGNKDKNKAEAYGEGKGKVEDKEEVKEENRKEEEGQEEGSKANGSDRERGKGHNRQMRTCFVYDNEGQVKYTKVFYVDEAIEGEYRKCVYFVKEQSVFFTQLQHPYIGKFRKTKTFNAKVLGFQKALRLACDYSLDDVQDSYFKRPYYQDRCKKKEVIKRQQEGDNEVAKVNQNEIKNGNEETGKENKKNKEINIKNLEQVDVQDKKTPETKKVAFDEETRGNRSNNNDEYPQTGTIVQRKDNSDRDEEEGTNEKPVSAAFSSTGKLKCRGRLRANVSCRKNKRNDKNKPSTESKNEAGRTVFLSRLKNRGKKISRLRGAPSSPGNGRHFESNEQDEEPTCFRKRKTYYVEGGPQKERRRDQMKKESKQTEVERKITEVRKADKREKRATTIIEKEKHGEDTTEEKGNITKRDQFQASDEKPPGFLVGGKTRTTLCASSSAQLKLFNSGEGCHSSQGLYNAMEQQNNALWSSTSSQSDKNESTFSIMSSSSVSSSTTSLSSILAHVQPLASSASALFSSLQSASFSKQAHSLACSAVSSISLSSSSVSPALLSPVSSTPSGATPSLPLSTSLLQPLPSSSSSLSSSSIRRSKRLVRGEYHPKVFFNDLGLYETKGESSNSNAKNICVAELPRRGACMLPGGGGGKKGNKGGISAAPVTKKNGGAAPLEGNPTNSNLVLKRRPPNSHSNYFDYVNINNVEYNGINANNSSNIVSDDQSDECYIYIPYDANSNTTLLAKRAKLDTQSLHPIVKNGGNKHTYSMESDDEDYREYLLRIGRARCSDNGEYRIVCTEAKLGGMAGEIVSTRFFDYDGSSVPGNDGIADNVNSSALAIINASSVNNEDIMRSGYARCVRPSEIHKNDDIRGNNSAGHHGADNGGCINGLNGFHVSDSSLTATGSTNTQLAVDRLFERCPNYGGDKRALRADANEGIPLEGTRNLMCIEDEGIAMSPSAVHNFRQVETALNWLYSNGQK